MTSRVRCTNCRGYADREECFWQGRNGMGRCCTEECFNEWKDRKKPSKRAVKEKRESRKKKKPGTPLHVRLEVKNRDKHVCRWCGKKGVQVHHVNYRSEGGPDVPENLILLCNKHHDMVHSSKVVYKPILLMYLWLYYTECGQFSMKRVIRFMDSEDILTDIQYDRLADFVSLKDRSVDIT